MKIFVTGSGVISSLGNGVQSNLKALLDEKSGLTTIELLNTRRENLIGGEIKLSNDELFELAELNPDRKIFRTNILGLIAAREAWANRVPTKQIKTAVFFGTTIGGINISDEDIRGIESFEGQNFELLHDDTFGTDLIARELSIQGYRATVSTACSTAANAIMMGARMIKAGLLDRALVGGAEAITNYTLNGFDSLQLYTKDKNRPFDRDRDGLNLGEGAGFLVLENEKSMQRSGALKLAELIGWGNACDAFHQTASSPEGTGAELALMEAIRIANIKLDEIDAINTHGTGTANNDRSESNYLKRCFNEVPPFSSTKSYIGHTLAAAGGIEAVYSILSLQEKVIFPNLNFTTPIEETGLIPVCQTTKSPHIETILSSSYGFGGNCTQLIFKR